MKLRAALLILFLTLAPRVALADFAAGQRAYDAQEWIKAITELRPLAEQGDDRALMLLGNMYNDGKGVLPDTSEAMDLYKKSAALGNPQAMVALGAMYQTDKLGAPDYKRAAQWFERGAKLGDQAAAFFYGMALLRGDPTGKSDFKMNEKQSYKWFRVAATSTQYNNVQAAAVESAQLMANRLTTFEMKTMNDEVDAFKPADPKTLGPLPGTVPDAPAKKK